ncbi:MULTISPECIES: hypothetical protein [unclassified Prochlorococcus]|uniref:hypothetical protein n=1 Tax=unclassified Prochlorococcus TaxID=2627481 RepID=UPI0005338CEF|nr:MULTISPECIES: hypothetical protein [unclassified Prochlorococcus]KGG23771.1 hypothetical protein EV12_3119 [Prochlorococcus sp. MIT 0701]KGG30072.1 hypothetical protein EV14_3005 [Prochlorococcus sp. MIT 0703]KGG30653.1 hypothetical protein EV13_0090 [Prochlorococcus sp. MIT 0702]
MTTINTDYNNTELLDQELTTAELSEVSGGWWNYSGGWEGLNYRNIWQSWEIPTS